MFGSINFSSPLDVQVGIDMPQMEICEGYAMHGSLGALGILITERQRMMKGCTISETKRRVFRFHETILRLGDWICIGLYESDWLKETPEGNL